jgi:hypothetical protein
MVHKGQTNNLVRQAFEDTLDILDERSKRSILLELGGKYDQNSQGVSLVKIANGLNRLFGAEAAELIIEKMLVRLDELAVTSEAH